tara:strand:+ start:4183 stop:4680 length:498 start_codon:yes stop_codon:yes gene_type:complete
MRFLSNTVFTTFLLFCSCHSPKEMLLKKHPPFVLENVFYKSWVGGQPGVRGLVLTFSCLLQAEGLQLDSIYFRKQWAPIEANANSQNSFAAYFANSPKRNPPFRTGYENTISAISLSKTPFLLKETEAVLAYSHRQNTGFFKIKEVVNSPSKKMKGPTFPLKNSR